MPKFNDCRDLFDPGSEIPDWFWEAIKQGEQNREIFQQVCEEMNSEKLIACDHLFADLAGWFMEEPFRPPHIPSTNNSCEETGWWVVSQGRDYFLEVWQNPELFWRLMEDEINSTARVSFSE